MSQTSKSSEGLEKLSSPAFGSAYHSSNDVLNICVVPSMQSNQEKFGKHRPEKVDWKNEDDQLECVRVLPGVMSGAFSLLTDAA